MGDDVFLSSRQVRERYGNLSKMTLWRLQNKANNGFPEPVKLGERKRLWRLRELEAWERANVRQRHA